MSQSTSISPESPTVEPCVKPILKEHEKKDSILYGLVVDVAPLNTSDPLAAFSETAKSQSEEQPEGTENTIDYTPETEQRVSQIKEADQQNEPHLIFLMKHPCGLHFVDTLPYEDANSGGITVTSLYKSLSLDPVNTNAIVGKRVLIEKNEEVWEMKGRENEMVNSVVKKKHYLIPGLIAGAFSILTFTASVLFSSLILLSLIFATIVGTMVYGGVFYIAMAARLDHPLPAPIEKYRTKEEKIKTGSLNEESDLTAIEHGQVLGIESTAPDELKTEQKEYAILKNTAIKVAVPPDEQYSVPTPTPVNHWNNTLMKRFVYSLSPSVEHLDEQKNRVIPVTTTDDGTLTLDRNSLIDVPERDVPLLEQIGDEYVKRVNKLLGIKVRQEIYY